MVIFFGIWVLVTHIFEDKQTIKEAVIIFIFCCIISLVLYGSNSLLIGSLNEKELKIYNKNCKYNDKYAYREKRIKFLKRLSNEKKSSNRCE